MISSKYFNSWYYKKLKLKKMTESNSMLMAVK